jgi:hypothetical protein
MSSTSDGASVPGKEAAADELCPARPLEVELEIEIAPGLARLSSSPLTWTSFGPFHGHTSWVMCRLTRFKIPLRTGRRTVKRQSPQAISQLN